MVLSDFRSFFMFLTIIILRKMRFDIKLQIIMQLTTEKMQLTF